MYLNSSLNRHVNYSNVLHTFSFDAAWTATADCSISGWIQVYNTTGDNRGYIKINDVNVMGYGNNSSSAITFPINVIVKQGDKISITKVSNNGGMSICAYGYN